ncbi:MAG: hypothetical protein KAS82_10565, partial [Bacteroidales bacterium]|nr:hypothetical protein [Bacteroidales bacterium]
KLTLNMDREIAGKAKKYAKSKGRSLSDLVENYLRFLTRTLETEEIKTSPKVKSLLGSIKVPEGFDYKKELSERLNEKYSEE